MVVDNFACNWFLSDFSINIACTGNTSGVATFSIGLAVTSKKGKPLNNTPLRLKLRKECYPKGKLLINIFSKVLFSIKHLDIKFVLLQWAQ